jgi:hypothetical protein
MADPSLVRRPRRLVRRLSGGVVVFAAEVLVVLAIGVLALAAGAVMLWVF